jgi:hypothetical protein
MSWHLRIVFFSKPVVAVSHMGEQGWLLGDKHVDQPTQNGPGVVDVVVRCLAEEERDGRCFRRGLLGQLFV